jgi:hypothetical protein
MAPRGGRKNRVWGAGHRAHSGSATLSGMEAGEGARRVRVRPEENGIGPGRRGIVIFYLFK